MNILVFSWRDPKHPLAGGAEQVMHEHMKGWIKAGHKVTLFSSRVKGLPKKEKLDGVKIARSGYQYLGVQITAFVYYLKNRKNFDFIVDQFHGIPFFTPLYSKKPILAVIQETAGKVWLLNPLSWPLNWIIGAIGYLGEPLVFIPYRRTIFMTGSESAKEDLSKMGIPKTNINVVPHGVIIQRPNPFPKKEKKKTVTFLGVLTRDKGIEDALKSFALLKNQDFQFWVIGKPEKGIYFKKLQNMVKDLELDGKVKFWGFVSQEKKFELLARSHILVNPSVKEGWGLVNIEANAMGTPVVSYKAAGLIDSVKENHNGVFCQENKPWNISKNIESIIRDKKRYEQLSKNSILWSKNFSWEKSCEIGNKLIAEVSQTT